VDLCSVWLRSGGEQLFVQAVGKPMLANRMPAPTGLLVREKFGERGRGTRATLFRISPSVLNPP